MVKKTDKPKTFKKRSPLIYFVVKYTPEYIIKLWINKSDKHLMNYNLLAFRAYILIRMNEILAKDVEKSNNIRNKNR